MRLCPPEFSHKNNNNDGLIIDKFKPDILGAMNV